MDHDEPVPHVQTIAALKTASEEIARELRSVSDAQLPAGGGSRPRGLPEDLRMRIIAVRGALFQRGIFDPLLSRFDSATVAPAPSTELAERFETIAQSLGGT